MAVAWPAGVPNAFVKDTYQRVPEDVVRRAEVAVGPPLRYLWAASRAQSIVGELALTETAYAAFETWRKDDLNLGRDAFDLTLFDHSTARIVPARFRGAPVVRATSGTGRRVRLEIRTDPPEPNAGTLSALAALHKAQPATWPASVPGCPRTADYERSAISQVVRPDDRNSPGGVLVSRLEGGRERVSLTLSPAELETFETWFEDTAALGVRDILFPVPGGTHTGCFTAGYTVAGSGAGANWRVGFERYLEARP